MSRSIWSLVALTLLSTTACKTDGSSDVTIEPEPWVWLDLTEDGPLNGSAHVLDPKLEGNPTLSLQFSASAELPDSGCQAWVYAAQPNGNEWPLLEAADFGAEGLSLTWDGRNSWGAILDPGPVQISLDLDCGERLKGFGETQVHIVRLGVVAVDFGGEDNIPLAYHKKELHLPGLTLLDGIPEYLNDRERSSEFADLDDAIGNPRTQPEPWPHAHIPPWRSGEPGAVGGGHHKVPAAYVAGTTISLTATMGQSALSQITGQPYPADGEEQWRDYLPSIRVVPDGYSSEDSLWHPGGQVLLDGTESLPDTLGRHELSITWRYQAQINNEWADIPGYHTTSHPMYLLMGPTQVPDGRSLNASPPVSWIGVIEELADAITGLPANNTAVVMDRLRETLHNDPWFVYNPSIPAYSDFEGPYIYWDDIWVEMTKWLDRSEGVALYCHSVACVLSSQANHLGIEAHYLTLGVGFRTHLTRAAGSDDWRQWSFNSHGITEFEGEVWDAAVDIDGDSNPDKQPVDPIQPMGLSVDDYFELLTADDIETVNFGRCFVY